MQQFLSAVLPSTGGYVLSVATPKSDGTKWFKNHSANSLQELEQVIRKLDAVAAKTVYYALGSFANNIDADGKVWRTKEKADRFKTLAFDVDPKDRDQNVAYATQRDMVTATITACAKIGIPEPVFVNSGNGIHCYYPLTEEISKGMWEKISELLRDALLGTGMILDASKVCDSSMVLRPVGTHNKKEVPYKPVKLMSKGGIKFFDPILLATALKKFVKTLPPSAFSAPSAAKKRTGKASPVMDALLSSDFPLAEAKLVADRCHQISKVVQARGNVAYPLWRMAVIGIAKHCTDGRAVAHVWSDGHPTYSANETDKIFDGWEAGPTTCKKLAAEGGKEGCAMCPKLGRITSPIQLGVPDVASPITINAQGQVASIQTLPKDYSVRGTKIIRIVDGEASLASDYLLFPSSRYKDAVTGKSMCLVEAQLPKEGWQTLELQMDELAKLAEFNLWLMNHQLFVHSELTLQAMRRYMLTYLQELQLETESNSMCSSFGWTDDGHETFILGARAIKQATTEEVRLTRLATNFAPVFSPRGSKDEWAKATNMFNSPGMEVHGLVFLMSLGSPLMYGSGLDSVLVNMYSTESGTGKTTTGMFAASAYGDPEKLKLTVNDTDNSVFKTMGVYGSLPVYIDEITKIDDNRPGRLGNIVYFVTQGREKIRMNKEGSFQECVEWKSISTSSSNKDLYSMLGEDVTADGTSMRVLQFNVPKNPVFNADNGNTFGYEMAKFLRKNYGLVGEEFVRAIMKMGGPEAVYEKAMVKFQKKFNFIFNSKERFWQAPMVIAYATGEIAKALGISMIDVVPCIEEGIRQIKRLRKDMDDGKMDCFDTLGSYVSANASKTIVFKHNTSSKSPGAVMMPFPHEAVVRVEFECTNNTPFTTGKMYINQSQLNEWCRERGVDRKAMLNDLSKQGVSVHRDRRIGMMRGTDKPIPATRVIEIDMKHPRFADIMNQSDLGIIPPTTLKLIRSA